MFFLELCFFDDPVDVGNLVSGSSAFSKSSLNIWKFTVHVLLKPALENFENYFTSMWDECNCAVVWAFFRDFPGGSAVKNVPAMQEIWVWSLGWEDPLEKEMAIHSSTIAWKIPWTEEPGRLQSTGSQRVGRDWMTSLSLWAFFGIAFLWDCNENWTFPVLWPLLSFPNSLTYQMQHFHSVIFKDLK